MTRVKICGLARREDALHAAGLGAEFLGIVLSPSPRRVQVQAVAPWIAEVRAAFPASRLVGVFVRPSAEEVARAVERLGLDLIQVHGLELSAPFRSPVDWIHAAGPEEARRLLARLRSAGDPWAVMADTPAEGGAGGTGRTFDWGLLGRPGGGAPRLFLAGGLDAENVGEAIRAVRPYAVDASSRLEEGPGRKDPRKVSAFIRAVRATDREMEGGEA
jgi:phosphoribosylanthranilate isomerase